MREMKDSGVEWIGKIPISWNLRRLRFLCDIQTGNMDTQNNDPNGEYPFYVRSPIVERSSTYTFDNEAVLMAGDGVGAGKVFHYVCGRYGCHQRVYSMSNFRNIQGKFLYYYLLENFYKKIEESNAKSTVDSVRLPMIKDFMVSLPTQEEQARIINYLDNKCTKIDAVIKRQQAVIEKLKTYKMSVITEVVTKGLNPDSEMKDSGIEWMGNVPKHWEQSTVSRAINFEGGSQPPLSEFISEEREGYVRLIQNRDYRTDDYKTYVPIDSVTKFCDVDDVMIGRYGPPLFVIHRGLKGAYNVAIMKANPLLLDREFMYFYLQQYTLLKYIESFSLRTAGQSGVNPSILKNYPIFIPPLDEQQVIANKLKSQCSKIDNYISKSEHLIEQLASYKKSLIYEVVTGKKEV